MTDGKDSDLPNLSREEVISALFANLVIQQTNMAFMFLGRVPHPETGEIIRDLESAQFFIDQLDMIEAKTKGNLDKREEGLLKQSLTSLRMAFVEAINAQSKAPAAEKKVAEPAEAPKPAEAQPKTEPEQKTADDESKKKFSKKY
jgi:hypothetical protein